MSSGKLKAENRNFNFQLLKDLLMKKILSSEVRSLKSDVRSLPLPLLTCHFSLFTSVFLLLTSALSCLAQPTVTTLSGGSKAGYVDGNTQPDALFNYPI